MKNKKIIIVIVVLLLLLAAYFGLGLLSKGTQTGLLTNPGKTAASGNQTTGKTVGEAIKGTLQEILAKGQNVRCTYSKSDDGTKVESSTYISGTKFSADSKITDEDNNVIEYHQISDGTWMYVWSTDQPTGMKMKFSDFQKPESNQPTAAGALKSAEAMSKYSYNCSPWIADSSKFNVPTNIEFQDISELMKGFLNAASGMNEELCKNCARLDSPDQIATCKASLNCKE